MTIKIPSGFGIGIPHQNNTDTEFYYKIRHEFRPKCWINWLHDQDHYLYFPMVWSMKQIKGQHNEIISSPSASTNKVWLLGNEPEESSQSDTSPEDFVIACRYWKKKVGLSFAVPGILWGENGRKWWSEYKRLRGPKPDAYHIHIYSFNGESYRSQLEDALRTFNDRPLIISEAAGWWTVIPMLQSEIQGAIKDSISNGMIPAAFWFSAHYGSFKSWWRATDLVTVGFDITDVGRTYKYYVG